MRNHKLAALLATTTVAATPTLVATRAAADDPAPPVPLHLDTGLDNMPSPMCELLPPHFTPYGSNGEPALWSTVTTYKGGTCPDGSVSLLYSTDRVHWKSMATGSVQNGSGSVEAPPWHGEFWYQSYYVTADNTAWGSTDSTSPAHLLF